MDAVLPLVLGDLERSRILRRSLARFFSGLGEVFVVCPDRQLREMQRGLAQDAQDGLQFTALAESEVVPELKYFKTMKGWYRQQLIKLAIAERVKSPFYLTFDADVFATRAVSPAQLAPQGKALCQVHQEDLHPDWYRNSQRLLGVPLKRQGITHNVTPAVLAKEGVFSLAESLSERWEQKKFSLGVAGVFQRLARLKLRRQKELSAWKLYLASGVPWTEYAVYYSHLELMGTFAQLHQEVVQGVCDEKRAYWRQPVENFASWNPEALFLGEGPAYFGLVQSNAGIEPQKVRKKLAPWLEG